MTLNLNCDLCGEPGIFGMLDMPPMFNPKDYTLHYDDKMRMVCNDQAACRKRRERVVAVYENEEDFLRSLED